MVLLFISTSNQMKYEGFIIEKGNKGKFEIYDKTLYYEDMKEIMIRHIILLVA